MIPPTMTPQPVARAADHDGGQEQDRQQQRNDSGLMNACRVANSAPDRPPMNAPHGEGQQLELEGRHAHQLGGVLVLAGGHPGPADPAVLAAVRSATRTMKITVSASQ